MGTKHIIQAVADWDLPRGTHAGPGHFIVDEVSAPADPHHDTVGAWAQMANNLYAHCRPPLILDAFRTDWEAAGTGSDETIAIYKVPGETVGTGKDTPDWEGLQLTAWAKKPGGTSSMKLAVATDTETMSITGASYGAHTTAAVCGFNDGADDPDNDVTVTITGVASIGSGLFVQSLCVDWWVLTGYLADGPFVNVFRPCPTDLSVQGSYRDAHEPVSVERMRRIVRNLIDLKRRRTPGMIATSYHRNDLSTKTPGATNEAFRVRTLQHEHASHVRGWIYGKRDNAAGVTTMTVGSVSQTLPLASTSNSWNRFDLIVPSHTLSHPRAHDFSVSINDCTVRGICAWWRPVDTL